MADQISTGLPELDRLLSEPLRPGEVAELHGPQATIKTDLWRRQLERAREDGKVAVYFDFEMAKPPDDPIMT